jgi:hypothetical protein
MTTAATTTTTMTAAAMPPPAPTWHGEWNYNSRRYVAAVTTILFLSTMFFILRIFSRKHAGVKLW